MGGNKKVLYVIISVLAIFILGLIYINVSKPSNQTIIKIICSNGIKINGSDADVLDDNGNKYDYVTYLLKEDEVKKFEIGSYGYDFIRRKYFCIAKIDAVSDKQIFFSARLSIMLNYNKGWQLEDDIGVLEARFHSLKQE